MFNTLQAACATNRRPAGMSLKQFLEEGLNLVHYLETHHSIEETYLYPLLGRKMPEFRSTVPPSRGKQGGKSGKSGKGKEECELIRQHRVIHDGMEQMEEYLQKCKNKECEFEMGVLKEKMEGWGEMLLRHLDEEVKELGAEKMRRYWTLQEMKAFPI
jgi:hemerythrin-like domain-containing protein